MASQIFVCDECKGDSVSYLTQFKRFVLYASTKGVYYPGARMKKQTHVGENLASLRILLNNLQIYEVFQMLQFVKDQQLNVHEEIIPLVLAECTKITHWKNYSIHYALKLLTTGREFLLFFKYAFEVLPSIGEGKIVMDFIREWYKIQTVKDLVEMIHKDPALYGVKHANLIKMTNVTSKSPERAAVYDFALGGVDRMNMNYRTAVKEGSVVLYFNRLNQFRQITDPVEAVTEMASTIYPMKDVHDKIRENKKIWIEAIPQMDLTELIDWIFFLCEKGYLRCPITKNWDKEFIQLISDRVKNFVAIQVSKIRPERSFQELQRIQNQILVKFQYAKSNDTRVIQFLLPPQPIVNAFQIQIEKSFVNVKPISMDISVVIDSTRLCSKQRCAFKTFVMADMAAAMIALAMKKIGRNVNIVTFDNSNQITLDSQETLSSIAHGIQSTNKRDTTQFYKIFEHYLINRVYNKDLVVVIGYMKMQEMYMNSVYAHDQNGRKPKFVFINLGGILNDDAIVDHERVLNMYGFDHRMIKLILAFGMEFII